MTADTFDAMYSNRPYRNRMNFDKAISIIQEVSGTQLASDVVDAFMRLVAKGEFRDPEDHGGGTTENIDNIHKAQENEKKPPEETVKTPEESGKKPLETPESKEQETSGNKAQEEPEKA